MELLCQTLHLQGFRGAPPLDKKAKLVTLGQTSSYIPSQWLAHGWECDLVHPEKERILRLQWELSKKTVQLDLQMKE